MYAFIDIMNVTLRSCLGSGNTIFKAIFMAITTLLHVSHVSESHSNKNPVPRTWSSPNRALCTTGGFQFYVVHDVTFAIRE